MSRVGKYPVSLPSGVDCQLSAEKLTLKGKLGQLDMLLSHLVKVDNVEGTLKVTPANDTQAARAMWGTTRKNIANMVKGVTEGFVRRLEIQGVGYRAAMQGDAIVLQLGHSHEVRYPVPKGITIKCPKPTQIEVEGIDAQKVGQVAAEIRAYRPPEPYKGKGVRFEGEYVLRKEGKKK